MTPEELKDHRKKYNKRYYENNKKKITNQNKIYHENNKKKISEQSKIYYQKNKEKILIKAKRYGKKYRENDPEKMKRRSKKYYENNKEKGILRIKNRKKIDPLYALSCSVRNVIYQSLKRKGYEKRSRTCNILGCTYKEFQIYFEQKFENWMTWENYGKYNGELNYGWDIDHIIPISIAKTEEDVINLNHYSNLQPLCSKINRDIKKDNMVLTI